MQLAQHACKSVAVRAAGHDQFAGTQPQQLVGNVRSGALFAQHEVAGAQVKRRAAPAGFVLINSGDIVMAAGDVGIILEIGAGETIRTTSRFTSPFVWDGSSTCSQTATFKPARFSRLI